MNIEIPGLNVKQGLDLYDGDEELYLIILRSYVDNTPEVLDQIRSVSAETLNNYASAVHGIKGTSANVGAEEIMQTAQKLEIMAKAGDLNGIMAENESFLKRADILIVDIRNWLEQNGL
ncbi:MAG: Hpt domain-containing protein [Treponema sp.]|nr:Hpt domain-containing protein [Treponema sp.]